MKAVKQGDAIECQGARVISRDIKLSSLVNIPSIGKCRKYNCKRNSEATITDEIPDKENRVYQNAFVELGDIVSGENIVVYVNSLKSQKVDVINYTGRHKAQKTETSCFTYAEISVQFHNIRELNDPNQLSDRSKEIDR